MEIARDLTAYEEANQSPPYVDVDLFSSDAPLQSAVAAAGGTEDIAELTAFGRHWGAAEMVDLGRNANENAPKLRSFDAKGFRVDAVDFHPAYHGFMAESMGAGLHASTWTDDLQPAAPPAQVVRAARFYMAAQIETGHLCPITMTRAAVAALAAEPALARKLTPKLLSRHYDPRFLPWEEKTAITLGMGMTERQGGTDVRTNTTRAEPASDGGYLITGQKWFMSAPMCDAFLLLAQASGGLTCFLMPRFCQDGSVNGLRFQRLKDKLGNRSNASSEVEFDRAQAWRVGEEGRGVRTIINMVQLTRLDCAIASAGIMRMALAQAIHHARYRVAFGRRLAEQPMMAAVLADMALEVEAATALIIALAHAFDRAARDQKQAAQARLLTPAVKYWVCKTAPALVCEAMECLGGNGYVEESVLPRLYREAPVNAIWEGSGNVMCLDVLRALGHERDAAAAVIERLGHDARGLPGVGEAMAFIRAALAGGDVERMARAGVGRLARVAAAAALRASAPEIAELFARTRLQDNHEALFGSARLSADEVRLLLRRALPE